MPKAAKQTPKPKAKRTRKPKNTCTALMIVPKVTNDTVSKRPSPSARIQTRMNQFVKAYELAQGNILAACDATGVRRRTYYRWLAGEKPIHKQFKARIQRIPVGEIKLDLAELTLDRAMTGGNVTAAFYVLNNKGQSRGYNLPQQTVIDAESITKLLDAFQSVLKENPNMSDAERSMWIKDFADSGGVPEETLARKIRVLELTGGK